MLRSQGKRQIKRNANDRQLYRTSKIKDWKQHARMGSSGSPSTTASSELWMTPKSKELF